MTITDNKKNPHRWIAEGKPWNTLTRSNWKIVMSLEHSRTDTKKNTEPVQMVPGLRET
jgi:hypothetical protein